MENMDFVLERYQEEPLRTFGRLYANGELLCDTLEDTDRHLEDFIGNPEEGRKAKVYGKTAIPTGRYGMTYYYWPKYRNRYPLLNDVPFFTGILIHGGITENQTLGCILIGSRSGEQLVNSGAAMEKIRNLFKQSSTGTITVRRKE